MALEFRTRDTRLLAPLRMESDGHFGGEYSVDTPGDYQVYARLTAPYGEVRTYLGTVKASDTPVLMPKQITLPVFDPLSRGWFSRSIELRSALPTGGATLSVQPGSLVARSASPEVVVEPSRSSRLVLIPEESAKPGDSGMVSYTAAWGEGQSRSIRHGAISVQIRQMSMLELVAAKWGWAAALVTLVLFACYVTAIYRPRSLRGCLTIVQEGKVVVKLDLPRDRAMSRVKVVESSGSRPSRPGELAITGNRDRDLVTLESKRRGRRWVCVAEPGAEPLLTARGFLPRNADLSDRRYSQFHTQDRTIEIKFYTA
jgi:hypothetical protein